MILELTSHGTKIVVESDDHTVITVMLNDGQTEKTTAFNYVPMDMFELIDGIQLCMTKHKHDGFIQEQRVRHSEYGIGTVICRSYSGKYGVEFDNYAGRFHDCGGVNIQWGRIGRNGGCRWVYASDIAPVIEYNLPESATFFDYFRRYIEEKEVR